MRARPSASREGRWCPGHAHCRIVETGAAGGPRHVGELEPRWARLRPPSYSAAASPGKVIMPCCGFAIGDDPTLAAASARFGRFQADWPNAFTEPEGIQFDVAQDISDRGELQGPAGLWIRENFLYCYSRFHDPALNPGGRYVRPATRSLTRFFTGVMPSSVPMQEFACSSW